MPGEEKFLIKPIPWQTNISSNKLVTPNDLRTAKICWQIAIYILIC